MPAESFPGARMDGATPGMPQMLFCRPLAPPCATGRLVHGPPERRPAAGPKATAVGQQQRATAAQHSRRRRLLGMAACFLVSGIMHEVQIWCAVPAMLPVLCCTIAV